MITKNMKRFENELLAASEKNQIIADAINSGLSYEFIDSPVVLKSGRVAMLNFVKFSDGVTFRLRLSKYCDSQSIVYVSDNMSAKMLNIASVSTSVLLNEYCQQRQLNPNSICNKCFAGNTVDRYSDLQINLASNTELLTTRIIPRELIPHFITDIVRFESFGDLNNIIQFINYVMIAVYNPGVYFTLWTKNAFIVRLVKRIGFTIPANLHLIKSSQFINKPCDNFETEIFDAVFTVYDDEFLTNHGYNEKNFVNCGGRSCRGCMNCYGKRIKKRVINERLK